MASQACRAWTLSTAYLAQVSEQIAHLARSAYRPRRGREYQLLLDGWGRVGGASAGNRFKYALGPASVEAATALLLEGGAAGVHPREIVSNTPLGLPVWRLPLLYCLRVCFGGASAGNRSKYALGPASVEAATTLLFEGVLLGVHPWEIVPNTPVGLPV